MSTKHTVFDAARRLQEAGTAYALVSVTKALPPASARPGDKAVVTADGQLHGWVGGGCAQPAVIRTVRQALADGRARMIRIAPAELGHETVLGDVLEFGMACHSGGTLELFIDPVLPSAQLVVIGASPVAVSLAQLAPRVGFAVSVVAHEAQSADFADAQQVIATDDIAAVVARVSAGAWVVVATQGRRDMQALRLALALNARQVSFVASARKALVLRQSLVAAGADVQAVAAIVAPAGYPMAATTPEEIALSVLAAVVSHRRSAVGSASLSNEVIGALAAEATIEVAARPRDSIAPAAAAGERLSIGTAASDRGSTGTPTGTAASDQRSIDTPTGTATEVPLPARATSGAVVNAGAAAGANVPHGGAACIGTAGSVAGGADASANAPRPVASCCDGPMAERPPLPALPAVRASCCSAGAAEILRPADLLPVAHNAPEA